MWSSDSESDEVEGGGGGPYCPGDPKEDTYYDVGEPEEVRCMENDPENLIECIQCKNNFCGDHLDTDRKMCNVCKRTWCAGILHQLHSVSVPDKIACAACGDAVCVQCRVRGTGAPDVTEYVTYYHKECCFPCEEEGCNKCYVDVFPNGSERPIMHNCTLCGRNVCDDHATLNKDQSQTDRYGRLVKAPVCSRHCVMCGETKPTVERECGAPNPYVSGDDCRMINLQMGFDTQWHVPPLCNKTREMCIQCWGVDKNATPKCPDMCEFMQLKNPQSDVAKDMRKADEHDAQSALSPEDLEAIYDRLFEIRTKTLSRVLKLNLATLTKRQNMLGAIIRRHEREGTPVSEDNTKRLQMVIEDRRDLEAEISEEEERLLSIKKSVEDLSQCGICQQPMTGDLVGGNRVKLSNCGHTFHYMCLKRHYETRRSTKQDLDCPMCRTKSNTRPASVRFLDILCI